MSVRSRVCSTSIGRTMRIAWSIAHHHWAFSRSMRSLRRTRSSFLPRRRVCLSGPCRSFWTSSARYKRVDSILGYLCGGSSRRYLIGVSLTTKRFLRYYVPNMGLWSMMNRWPPPPNIRMQVACGWISSSLIHVWVTIGIAWHQCSWRKRGGEENMPARKRANLYLQSVNELQQQEEHTAPHEQEQAGGAPIVSPAPDPPPPPLPKSTGGTQVKITFYLSEEQVAKIDGYIQEFHRQTGVRPNRNDIIRRLVDRARPEDILPVKPSPA